MNNYLYQSYEEPRTAGAQNSTIQSIQSWKNKNNDSAKEEIIASLNQAADEKTVSFKSSLRHSLSYAPQENTLDTPNKEAFEFSDIIDIVNPLQHVPVVSSIYRNLTGDDLHPLSGIIGGGLYGGPLGAVSGTVNAVSKIQTGKDLGEHTFDILGVHRVESKGPETDIKADIAKLYQDDITTLTLAAIPPRQI